MTEDELRVLEFLAEHQGQWSTHGNGYGMPTVQDVFPPGTPVEVQLALMKHLHEEGYVGGCHCGCRGDWEITNKGLGAIGKPRTEYYSGYDPWSP